MTCGGSFLLRRRHVAEPRRTPLEAPLLIADAARDLAFHYVSGDAAFVVKRRFVVAVAAVYGGEADPVAIERHLPQAAGLLVDAREAVELLVLLADLHVVRELAFGKRGAN